MTPITPIATSPSKLGSDTFIVVTPATAPETCVNNTASAVKPVMETDLTNFIVIPFQCSNSTGPVSEPLWLSFTQDSGQGIKLYVFNDLNLKLVKNFHEV